MFLHYFALCHKYLVITQAKQQNAKECKALFNKSLAQLLPYIYTNGTALGQSRTKSK